MRVHVLLADKGTNNPQAGTLNLLNAGWGTTGANPLGVTPSVAVVVFFEADYLECNRPLAVALHLQDQDGHVVDVPGPAGPQPMRMEQTLTVISPPGAPHGMPGKANLMIEMQPGLPLAPGIYKWVVVVEGQADDDWSVTFWVSSPPVAPVFGGPAAPAQPAA